MSSPPVVESPQVSPHTLCQLPSEVWLDICKFLKLQDLFRLFLITDTNVKYACWVFLKHQQLTFNVNDRKVRDFKNYDGEKFYGSESPAVLKIMKRLGGSVQNVYFHTDSFYIEQNTYACMMKSFVANPLLELMSIEFIVRNICVCTRIDTSEVNWSTFVSGLVKNNTTRNISKFCLYITNSLHLIVLATMFSPEPPSDPWCQLITSLKISAIPRKIQEKWLSDFLSKFWDLQELDMNVSCLDEMLLKKLAPNKGLSKLIVRGGSAADRSRKIPEGAWKDVAKALPDLRVGCTIIHNWEDAIELFNESTPMCDIEIPYVTQTAYPHLLKWCEQFKDTLKTLRICALVTSVSEGRKLLETVEGVCERARYLQNPYFVGDFLFREVKPPSMTECTIMCTGDKEKW